MSSDFYPSSLSRNLVRTGTLAYREYAALGLVTFTLKAPIHEDLPYGLDGSFDAYPDFSHRLKTSVGATPIMRAHLLGHTRLATLAASLEKLSDTGSPPT